MSGGLLGIEIGGTKLQIVLGDALGHISKRYRATVDRARGGPGILDQIQAGISELCGGGPVRGVAVGFGGPVDQVKGRICVSHQIDGWDDFPLGDWLRERARAPVVVENDANTAAYGEAFSGAGALG